MVQDHFSNTCVFDPFSDPLLVPKRPMLQGIKGIFHGPKRVTTGAQNGLKTFV